MSPSGAEFIRQVKTEISEIDPSAVHELVGNGVAIVDVRETEEYATGHLPGARHVPRGYLESRIEGIVPDRAQRVGDEQHGLPQVAEGRIRWRCARFRIEEHGRDDGLHVAAGTGAEHGTAGTRVVAAVEGLRDVLDVVRAGVAGHELLDERLADEGTNIVVVEDVVQGSLELVG